MPKVHITETVLRDGHQSLIATRMRTEDMLPVCKRLDQVGYWSLEVWGGATFDACVRFLKEDPWDRLRQLRKAIPNTRLQMLLRGQNLVGYRHYSDDVVETFVKKAADNGIDVFRIFDALNDLRNIETSVNAVKKSGKHAQGCISYTTSPVHTIGGFVEDAKKLEAMGCDSIAIKDMAGLLTPTTTEHLVSELTQALSVPVQIHSHATAGLASMCQLKAIENGCLHIDTAISSFAEGASHPATESMVAALKDSDYDTGLDLPLLQDIGFYFQGVRSKYHQFESEFTGLDTRVQVNQVPGGMISNLTNQLRDQGELKRINDVLDEIPLVRQDLGYPPLVTPTSQIVGTQAVLNILTGERYKSITKETQGVLKGEYGATPAPMNTELQARVLDGAEAITCRPADLIEPELEVLTAELREAAKEKGIELASGEREIDDVLTYALFPQIGLKFLENRNNPDAFEPVPTGKESGVVTTDSGEELYTVTVEGVSYSVTVGNGGDVTGIGAVGGAAAPAAAGAVPTGGDPLPAPLAGNIFKVLVSPGQQVNEGDTLIILEAMKMETEVSASKSGTVGAVNVKEGDSVAVGDLLLTIA